MTVIVIISICFVIQIANLLHSFFFFLDIRYRQQYIERLSVRALVSLVCVEFDISRWNRVERKIVGETFLTFVPVASCSHT